MLVTVTVTDRAGRVDRHAVAVTVTGRPSPHEGPGPATTGYRHTGVALRPYTGPSTISTPGAVLDGYLFTGPIVANAPGVVVRRSLSRWNAGTVANFRTGSAGSLLLEDVEVDGLGGSANGVASSRFTARRVDVHHCYDGLRTNSDTVVEDSWVHDLAFASPDSHADCIQKTGGGATTLRRNRLDAMKANGDYANAAVIAAPDQSAFTGPVLVEDNIVSGGLYTFRLRGPIAPKRNRWVGPWQYGPATLKEGAALDVSNVHDATDRPVLQAA